QYMVMTRMVAMQSVQGLARLDILAPVDLQLGLGQADGHAGAGFALARTPQQLIALLVPAQLIGSPCRAQEVHQRLAVMLGSNLQVGQSAAPLPLGQLAQAIARSFGDTALAVAT